MLSNDVVQWCCPQEFMGIFTDGNCFYFTLLHFTPLYSTQTTPNGTQLKRGAGGSLLKPMFKSKGTIVLPLKQRKTKTTSKTTSKTTTKKKKKQPLLRFRLEEVARPSAVVLEEIAVLLVNG